MIKLDRMLKNIPRTTMVIVLFPLATTALAHCDTMDGPVVASARTALNSGDITPALAWIQRDDEPEIRGLFGQILTARKAGGETRELVDRLFFENLVRAHRAGEGAPYTGLKPAGQIEPPVALADRAIATSNINEMSGVITRRVREGLQQQFRALMTKKSHALENPGDLEAARAYANSYVEYVHYVERLYDAAETLAPDTSGGHMH